MWCCDAKENLWPTPLMRFFHQAFNHQPRRKGGSKSTPSQGQGQFECRQRLRKNGTTFHYQNEQQQLMDTVQMEFHGFSSWNEAQHPRVGTLFFFVCCLNLPLFPSIKDSAGVRLKIPIPHQLLWARSALLANSNSALRTERWLKLKMKNFKKQFWKMTFESI